jgi:hypothetical protein
MSFKHKYYEDEEDPLLVIKPSKYLEIKSKVELF